MRKKELKKLTYYKKIIKLTREKLISDFNDEMDHLNCVEKKVDEEIKKLRLE